MGCLDERGGSVVMPLKEWYREQPGIEEAGMSLWGEGESVV